MTKTINRFTLGLALAFCLGQGQVFASTPTEQIQATIQQVLKVVSGSSNGEEERKEMLRNALMPRFDWAEMAKQALGKHWNSVASRKDNFIAAFAKFLVNSYVDRIGITKMRKSYSYMSRLK